MKESPAQREAELIEKYGIIEDAQERLHVLCGRAPKVAPLAEEDCREEFLVRGCSSPVWLEGTMREGRLHLRMTSPTPLVRSLAGIVCDLCDGALAEEVQNFTPTWPERLGVQRFLSEARQKGLAAIWKQIRSFA